MTEMTKGEAWAAVLDCYFNDVENWEKFSGAIEAFAAACAADPLTVMEKAAKLTNVVEVQWDAVQGGFYYTIYGEPATRAEAEAVLKGEG